MDLTESIAPRSDQVNADDLIAGPVTYTIREVVGGKAEAPFDFMLVETDRAYRPSKTMRRVIVNAWGPETKPYAGRRLTLYREPSIKFGGATVGGIRISHMSHIDGPKRVLAQTSRGKREEFVVQPLPDQPPSKAPSDPLAALWRKVNTIPGDQAKAFLVSAVGHELDKATDVTPDEAADILAKFDALLADFMGADALRQDMEAAS